MTNITTCQICGRAIQAKRGTIAHHGYTRPGHGWQTRSCFGAGYRPWEVACDALPPAIAGVQATLVRTRDALTDLIENPPAELKGERRDAYGRVAKEWTCELPADFDRFNRPASYTPRTYAQLYWTRRFQIDRDIKQMDDFVAELERRLAEWKPAEAAA